MFAGILQFTLLLACYTVLPVFVSVSNANERKTNCKECCRVFALIQTVGVRDATTRTRPLGGGPGARGKRKRAVDFFRQSSSTESTGSRTAEAGGRSNLRTGIRDKFDGATGVDVLEEAYRSALALSTVPMPPAYNDPAQAGNDPKTMSSVQSERRDAAQNAPNDISQASSSDSDFSREESSTKTDPSESEPSKKIEVSRCAKPRAEEHSSTASSDPAWVGNRAVDAEGLIWVDEAQTTAYSVRYVTNDSAPWNYISPLVPRPSRSRPA